MKKENIYVAVSGKKQAKQFKAILLALGEEVREDFWKKSNNTEQNQLICTNNFWVIDGTWERTQITIKELIKLLVTPNNIVKVEEPKQVKIDLDASYKITIDFASEDVYIDSFGEYVACLTFDYIKTIYTEINKLNT